MPPVDKKLYTRREAGKELAAIEQHCRGFNSKTAGFCMECLGKHCMHLAMLSDEGKTFFPEDQEFWQSIGDFANGILDRGESGPTIEVDECMKWADEARDLRKSLQSKYMGQMGTCQCLTGMEDCCHGKAN